MKVEDIKNPLFIKNLNLEELNDLCKDIREYLINHMGKNGGFLGSNLSVVEITVALHYVFNFAYDYLFFDVGYNSIIHKLLKGENNTHIDHSYKGDTLAMALGLAIANSSSQANNEIIVVVDGASFYSASFIEGLKAIDLNDKKIIVILNDNRGLDQGYHLNSLYSLIKYSSQIEEIKASIVSGINKNNFTKSIYGTLEEKMTKKGDIFSNVIKSNLIDGHNIKELIKALKFAKKAKNHTIIHCITKLNKGYKLYENSVKNNTYTKAFDIKSAKPLVLKPVGKLHTYEALAIDLIDIIHQNEQYLVFTNLNLYDYHLESLKLKIAKNLVEFKDCDHLLINAAIGASIKTNVYLIMSSTVFIKIYNEYLKYIYHQNLNINLILLDSHINSNLDDIYQGTYVLPLLNHLKDLSIYVPSNHHELKYALNNHFQHSIIRLGDEYFSKNETINKDEWYYMIHNKDSEATILSYGMHIYIIEENVKINNLKYDLINCTNINQVDTDLLDKLVNDNKPIIVYQLDTKQGGLANAVKDYLHDYAKLRIMALSKPIVDKKGLRNIIINEHMTMQDIKNEVEHD